LETVAFETMHKIDLPPRSVWLLQARLLIPNTLHAGRLALPWTAHLEHQEVWAGPSWSSTALRYDVAFFWSINPFYHKVQGSLLC
jgi:hypothetical protein